MTMFFQILPPIASKTCGRIWLFLIRMDIKSIQKFPEIMQKCPLSSNFQEKARNKERKPRLEVI